MRLLSILFLFGMTSLIGLSQAQTVVVDGEGVDKESAIYSALRQAVEQVGGVQIRSSTQTQDFTVVKDVILSEAKGYVSNYEILNEGRDRYNIYHVKVRATVNPTNIPSQASEIAGLLQQKGYPKFLLDVTETIYDGSTNINNTQRMAELKIRQLLSDERGVTVKSARDLEANKQRELQFARESGNRERAIQIAKELGFDYIIRGSAKVNKAFEKVIYGRKRIDYVVSMTADAIRVSDATFVGTAEILKKQIGQGQSDVEVSQLLLRNAGRDFADRMFGRIIRHWISDVNRFVHVQLHCTGIGFGDLDIIGSVLSEISGVQSYQQETFDQGAATFQVQFRGKTNNLAKGLHNLRLESGRFLKIQSVSDTKVVAQAF